MRASARRRFRNAAFAALLCAASLGAQPPSRIATTPEALIASAVFFHGRSVVVQQKLVTDRDLTRLATTAKPVYVFWKDRPGGDEGEVRGEFWDLGRIEARDSRFTGIDLSLGGASVFTSFNVDVGTFLRVTSERHDVTIISIVRGKHIGGDGIIRLHLEFIDRHFPLEGID